MKALHWRVLYSHLRIAGDNSPVDSQIIAILKDYWLPIVVAFAALGL
jgi:hypothetical protein